TEHHAASIAAAQADVIAADLDRRLHVADLLLRLLARSWQTDPHSLDLAGLPGAPPGLPEGAELFLLDPAGRILQASRPGAQDPDLDVVVAQMRSALLGQPDAARLQLIIGRAVPNRQARPTLGGVIPAASSADRHARGVSVAAAREIKNIATARRTPNESFAGAAGMGWHIDLARALSVHGGGFAGALVMAVPLRSLLASGIPATAAPHHLVALVGTRSGRLLGAIGAVPGRYAGLPPGAAAADVPALAALHGDTLASTHGSGIGPLVRGGSIYLYAFHRVSDRPLAVLVGLERAELLRAPRALATETRRFALAISALILMAALVVLGEVEAMRRRERRLARDRGALAAANTALAGAKREADAKTAQLEGLLAGLPDGVVMFDADMRLVAWNSQVADIAGIPPRLLRFGEPFVALVRAQAEAGEFGHGDSEVEVAHRLARVQSSQPRSRIERPRPDGRIVELRRELLPGGGFITLFSEITERKRAENALREAHATAEAATAGKSHLVAMVSHEIRTPLQALLHGIELLEDAPLEPMFRHLLAGMRQAGGSMARLLEDILDVSRMEAGRLTLHPERCDPRRPLERAVEMLRPVAAERGVSLALDVAADVPAAILVDPARLQQVVVNLLSNAAKFSRPGLVRLCAGMAPGPVLLVAVTDQGPPIAPEQRALLFRPFSRLASSGQAAAGTGLGLAICRDLVVLMGGEIGCAAADAGGSPTTGTTSGNMFWFTVPLDGTVPGLPAAPLSDATIARGVGPRARLRILLVEDVAVSRLVTTTLLRREGHAVHPVTDGAAALQAAARNTYDVVLMDVQLPSLDGLAATRAIRALPGAAGAMPIIGLTGSASPEECAACLLAGMGEVLAKPVGHGALLDALARHAGPIRGPATAPGTGRPSRGAVLSESRLAELRDHLAPATLTRIAEECLTGLAELRGRLRRAIADHDVAAAIAAAHAMAGLAGGYGLAALERAVRVTEAALRSGRLDDAAMQGAGLEAELARAADGLRQALRTETV
ncbi:MAG: PAS-domain containing protein, partial [Acetobacteraceae bacterium]